jgi:hypothetical protein
MSAAEALKAAHEAGLEIEIEGDDLVVEVEDDDERTACVLDLLRRHKACIFSAAARRRRLICRGLALDGAGSSKPTRDVSPTMLRLP